MSDERVLPVNKNAGTISFTVMANGTEVPATTQIMSVLTNKEINRIPMARLVIKDGNAATEDFAISNLDTFIPGSELEIKAGYDQQYETIFKGIVIRHGIKVMQDGSAVLQVECRDKAVKMTMGRHNKYFTEVQDSDVMEELISAYGLTATVESTQLKHKELVQYYSTDWDFLLSRAEMNGKLVLVSDGAIEIKAPVMSGNAPLSLTFGDTLYEFEAEMDARHQYKSVKCKAWDHAAQAVTEEEGSAPAANGMGDVSESDLADTIGLSSLDYVHGGQLVNQELKAWADGQLVKSHLAKVVGRAKLRGFPTLKLGALVSFAGVGNRFIGKGYITAIRQDWANGEWYTHIQFGRSPEWFYREYDLVEKPASGLVPGVNGLQIGIVTKLEGDPNGEFRIKVRLPLVDAAHEGIWARQASLDAGNNRGFVFRPEIDDEVIVGFLNDDPRDPVVLGMLHSSAKPAPIEPKDDNHEKGLLTRGKLKLHFDDDKKILTLATPAGKTMVFDEDAGEVRIEDENGNKIVMDSSGILIESAKDIILKATGDIKAEGVNIQQKSSAQFKLEGGAGMEVKSSAITTVKGSLVQIN
jgi:Rhs element Vgr protein